MQGQKLGLRGLTAQNQQKHNKRKQRNNTQEEKHKRKAPKMGHGTRAANAQGHQPPSGSCSQYE